MHIVARARAFVQSLRAKHRPPALERRRCPVCGSTHSHRHGQYLRRPITLDGRRDLAVQRYKCQACGATHSDEHPDLAPGAHYARSVRRYALDQWLQGRSSLRRVAEQVRSVIGHQERWRLWCPVPDAWGPQGEREKCCFAASTLSLWLDQAGLRAQQGVAGMYEGVGQSGLVGADGLWARLRGGAVRVLLMVRDSVTGLLYPPVVAAGEEAAAAWKGLFARARRAGLDLEGLQAVVSDGAQGLLSHLRQGLPRVYQQRCIFHLWRNLSPEISRQAGRAAEGLEGEEARLVRERVRGELVRLVHGVLDAADSDAGEEALARLREHPRGEGLWKALNGRLIEALAHTLPGREGVGRVSPEWMWRDFRQRVSRGRNHGDEERLERAGLVFTIYRNFTPAQVRRERTRHYRHPGQSALEVAGTAPEGCSYLDALEV
jgi:transposase-like protein